MLKISHISDGLYSLVAVNSGQTKYKNHVKIFIILNRSIMLTIHFLIQQRQTFKVKVIYDKTIASVLDYNCQYAFQLWTILHHELIYRTNYNVIEIKRINRNHVVIRDPLITVKEEEMLITIGLKASINRLPSGHNRPLIGNKFTDLRLCIQLYLHYHTTGLLTIHKLIGFNSM